MISFRKTHALLTGMLLLPSLASAQGLLKFVPPKTGAPATIAAGATRSGERHAALVRLLAPKFTAYSNSAQPVLYWYAGPNLPQSVEISIVKEQDGQVVLEKQLDGAKLNGLQRIDLAELGLALAPGQDYRWSVFANDAQAAGLGATEYASAMVRYHAARKNVKSPEQLAAAGYWYDALQQLLNQHSARVPELLSQIGVQIPQVY